MSELLEAQNRVIISLLARNIFGIENVEKIVTTGKKEGRADAYVTAYNQLDGTKSAKAIADTIGVSKQAVSEVFQTWEREGIVYKVNEKYIGLLKLPEKASTKPSKKAKSKPATNEENLGAEEQSGGTNASN